MKQGRKSNLKRMACMYFQFLSCRFYGCIPVNHTKRLHFRTPISAGITKPEIKPVQCSPQNEVDETLSLWIDDIEQLDTRRRETLFQLLLAAFSSPFIASAAVAIAIGGLFLNSKLITAQEVEDQREFDYVKGSGKGPESWGDIHHEWADCKNGSLQSPIDLLHERVEVVPDLGKIKRSYRTSNAILKNRGHDIELKWKIGTAGSIQINGTDYALEQCHWHSPSEHTINGHEFALELHMVHRNLELNKTAVIGVLFNVGEPDKFLSEIEKEIKAIADSNDELNVGMINPKHIKIGGPMYYRYLGSLTTPPCSEGVIWTINKKVRTVSVEQMKLLRTAVHDDSERNARPLQPLNDRDILFYDPMNRHFGLNK